MTRLFERTVIAGVGLIGGSLALAARRAGLLGEVVGLGRTQQNLDIALANGIVDRVSQDSREAARGADFVLLAVPVAAMASLVADMADVLQPGAVVSDVGSVKGQVVREVSAVLPPGVRFVGAHPIAGTEESGAAAAHADLFRGARCIVTPTADTDAAALAAVKALWEGVGAVVDELSPERHDEVLAWVSHVPHMLAFALMRGCPPDARTYAGPSFRDATRVAASSTEMWRDIAVSNGPAIGAALDLFLVTLGQLREAIRRGDAAVLSALLAEARAARLASTETGG